MQPDRVITSQQVFLGVPGDDGAHPLALAVTDGRVSAVAPRNQARVLSAGAPIEDWGDAFVCPGFHDAHQHVFHAALFPSELATEYAGTSEADWRIWRSGLPDDPMMDPGW